MKYLRKFADSSKELGRIQSLSVCAMMLALRVVLGSFGNFSLAFIPLPVVKISLTFIPIIITAYLFGPVCAAVVAGAGDVLSYLLAPTPLPMTPGITACYIIEGIILGVVLYNEEMRLGRVLLAKGLDLLLCTLSLNSLVLWLLFYQSTPFYLIVLYRAAVLIPFSFVEVFLLFALKKPLDLVKRKFLRPVS